MQNADQNLRRHTTFAKVDTHVVSCDGLKNLHLDSPLPTLSRRSISTALARSTSFDCSKATPASPKTWSAAHYGQLSVRDSQGLKRCATWTSSLSSPKPQKPSRAVGSSGSILKKHKTVGAKLSVAFSNTVDELHFFKATPAHPSKFKTCLASFFEWIGQDSFLHKLQSFLPDMLARMLPVMFKPRRTSVCAGLLPDYVLGARTAAEEAEVEANTAFVKRRLAEHQKDLILEDDDDLTNGFFTSHIGVHGADPERWVVWNAELALTHVPDVVADIRAREAADTARAAFAAWRLAVGGSSDMIRRKAGSKEEQTETLLPLPLQ